MVLFLVDIISAMGFDASGDYLAVGDQGGRVVIFERKDGKHVRNFCYGGFQFFKCAKQACLKTFVCVKKECSEFILRKYSLLGRQTYSFVGI